jgi:pimeloyl-ACP methyl ester carboxylesterase
MNKTQKFQVSGVVANEQNRTKTPASSATTTDNMKVPGRGDKALNCKVSFQIVNIVNSEENRCKLLLQPIVTQVGGDRSRRESVLTQNNKKEELAFTDKAISNECATDFRFCGADYQSMWIITHGMSADSSVRADNHLQTGKAISSSFAEAKPLVLFYDWGDMSQDAGGANPTNVDQYLTENTSYALARRMKSWGMKDTTNLNLVGHSMGTMLINQLAIGLQQKEGMTGEINRMFYLDPPKWPNGQFEVDDKTTDTMKIYNKNNGYNSKSVKAKIQRAFTGIDKGSSDNLCGNSDFAKTANEVVMIKYLNAGNGQGCRIHGGIPYAFAEIVRKKGVFKIDFYDFSKQQDNTVPNGEVVSTIQINILNDQYISNTRANRGFDILLNNNGYSNNDSLNLTKGEILSDLNSNAIGYMIK